MEEDEQQGAPGRECAHRCMGSTGASKQPSSMPAGMLAVLMHGPDTSSMLAPFPHACMRSGLTKSCFHHGLPLQAGVLASRQPAALVIMVDYANLTDPEGL